MAGEKEFTTAPEPRPDMAPQRGPADLPFSTPEEGTFIPKIPGSGPASPTRRKRGLLDLKTDLKSLKYSQFGADPLITKDINNPPRYNSASNQVTRRADDLVRITKLLASGKGVKFLAKQGLLSQVGLNREGTTKQKLLQGLKNGAINVAKVAGSTLAQVPVSGTGVHFIRGFTVDNYLKTSAAGSGLNAFLTTVRNAIGNQDNTRTIIDNDGDNYRAGEGIDNQPDSLKSKYRDLNLEKKFEKSNKDYQDKAPKRENTLQYRTKIGNQGGRGNLAGDGIDRLNELEVRSTSILTDPQFGIGSTPQDIIPFEFNIITPETKTGTYSLENFLYFRAHLNSFADNFTGNWNSTKYIGRAEPVYTYDGFDRQVSFGFKMAAFTKEELLPLYHKLNFLVSSTSPTYDDAGAFMRGTYAKLTIGDYLTDVPGFFGSVNVAWEVAYPWEIGIDEEGNESNLPRVPHILNIDCSFTPIHSFTPSVNSQFILNDTYKVGVPRTLDAPAAADSGDFTGLPPRPPAPSPAPTAPTTLTNPFG